MKYNLAFTCSFMCWQKDSMEHNHTLLSMVSQNKASVNTSSLFCDVFTTFYWCSECGTIDMGLILSKEALIKPSVVHKAKWPSHFKCNQWDQSETPIPGLVARRGKGVCPFIWWQALVGLKRGTGVLDVVWGAHWCTLEPVQEKKSGAPLCADIVWEQ